MIKRIWTSTATLHRDNTYSNYQEYLIDFQEYNQHYGFKVRLWDGWKFFEFEDDYKLWKNTK